MAQSFSAPFFFYNTLRLGVISMSYFTAAQIGKALSKARVSAGLSQREIAIRLQKGDAAIDKELHTLVQALPPLSRRLLLFVLKGRHGSSPPAVISEIAANLHCPLNNRVSVCGTIIDQYSFAQIRGLDPCPDEPHPPMEDLKINYKSGRAASENGALGYIGRRKE